MDFAPLASPGPVIARTAPTFRRRRPRATIQDGGRGLSVAPFGFTQQETQVVDEGGKAACRHPVLDLLIDDVPRRQVIRHHAPGRTCSCDPAQAVEDFAQAVGTLPGTFGHQRQVRHDEGPFFVADVSWIRCSSYYT